ncbi:MAG: sulfatase-like hydrolase/transferase [Verrucomicrobiota bacterium]
MNSRHLALATFCLCASITVQKLAAEERKEQPNILLIFADDIGYEALNCYGGLDFETPNLNRMAEEGLRFSRAYASPVCTPSRVSLHTGLYTSTHRHVGVLPVHRGTDKKVDLGAMPTFAQLMRKDGYATSTTGKWQLATLEVWPDHIREAGFDSWCVWQIWKDGAKTLRHWTPTLNEDGAVREDIADRYGPDVITDYVIEQMSEAKAADQPFLIVHNELLPHDPIVETPHDRKLDRAASLGSMISYLDHLVGRLLDATEALGIRENTYIFFMGDNGTHEADFLNPQADQPGQGKHTRHTEAGFVNGGKYQLGDAGTHVPLLVWGPTNVPVSAVCHDLIDIVDLFPTFCELSNTTLGDDLEIHGISFAPQISGQPARVRREWVHQAIHFLGEEAGKNTRGGENLFDGSWRLFRHSGELWDSRELPAETKIEAETVESEQARARLEEIFRSMPAPR